MFRAKSETGAARGQDGIQNGTEAPYILRMTQNTLRVASYNIRKARGLDQRRAPERIAEVINGLGADIVVLQEADMRLGERVAALPRQLVEAETDFRVVDVASNAVSLGWHGNAVLVRDAVHVADVRPIDLPGLEPRGAVRVDVTIGVDAGVALSVIATHLGLMRRSRQVQLEALRDAADENAHTVIAGDFNEWSPTRGLAPLEGPFTIHAPGRSFHARRPVAALDRIALSCDLRLRDAGVEQGPLARRASDHLPVWADIAQAAA